MKEIFEAVLAYKFGSRFRRLVFLAMIFLVAFHALVLISPFVALEQDKLFFSETQINHLQAASNSLANITIAVVLMFLVIEGQNGLRAYIIGQRRGTYQRIRQEILDWMKETKPLAFDEDAAFISGGKSELDEVLQHLKVTGSPSRLMQVYDFPQELNEVVSFYCGAIHFEFTRYPAELLYGIHIEVDDYEVSHKLSRAISESLNLGKQSADFKLDTLTPKKAGWVFMTRRVELSGEIDKDLAKVMTHARHFVELVCHSYDGIYSKDMIERYRQLLTW